jgi:hypothetical protein
MPISLIQNISKIISKLLENQPLPSGESTIHVWPPRLAGGAMPIFYRFFNQKCSIIGLFP